jgi:hypothetical protein
MGDTNAQEGSGMLSGLGASADDILQVKMIRHFHGNRERVWGLSQSQNTKASSVQYQPVLRATDKSLEGVIVDFFTGLPESRASQFIRT